MKYLKTQSNSLCVHEDVFVYLYLLAQRGVLVACN